MNILITGTAGFIGMHAAKAIAEEGFHVTGLDNINSYYDTGLKYSRLQNLGVEKDDILYNRELKGNGSFSFIQLDLNDAGNLMALFARKKFDVVIHLAAQAGVRYSITNPKDYINSNILGFFNVLEACRTYPVKHLIYASSSSVYGDNPESPFKTTHRTDTPISLYAATKKTNEILAYTYSFLYKIPCTGLRFFTVYGPWGRPDMAYFSFTKNILEHKPISLYNNGHLKRDFTYIDDVIEPIKRLIDNPPDFSGTLPGYRLLNVGNQHPVELIDFVHILEQHLGQQAIINYKPMQPGDVYSTYADTMETQQLTGFSPNTPIEFGLKKFVDWYVAHYKE